MLVFEPARGTYITRLSGSVIVPGVISTLPITRTASTDKYIPGLAATHTEICTQENTLTSLHSRMQFLNFLCANTWHRGTGGMGWEGSTFICAHLSRSPVGNTSWALARDTDAVTTCVHHPKERNRRNHSKEPVNTRHMHACHHVNTITLSSQPRVQRTRRDRTHTFHSVKKPLCCEAAEMR